MFLNSIPHGVPITKNSQPPAKRNFVSYQRGISMAFLLFIVVILSLLAAGLVRLSGQSNLSNAQQVISTRAFFAAESGANIQAMAIFPINGAAGSCVNQVYNFNQNGLNNCTSTTTCTNITVNTDNYYQITSAGQCNSGQPLQATRTIEIRLKGVN